MGMVFRNLDRMDRARRARIRAESLALLDALADPAATA
jgi:hypothetical protein